MKRGLLFLFVLSVFFITTHGSVFAQDSPLGRGWGKSPLKIGWVIGNDESNSAVILHTGSWGWK